MKILVADDDRVHRHMIGGILTRWGHDVVEAADGDQAWAVVQANPDLKMLLLDWEMPGIDGPEICQRVRTTARQTYLFVLLVTSRTGREDFLEGMRAGADDFITKPVDADELSVRVRAAERVVNLHEDLGEHIRKLSEANERMRLDLVAAAKVQRSFFPLNAPVLPGWRFAWTFIPCEYVAGDLLNVFQLDETHWAFYILDVSGHGVPAALLSVSLSHLMNPKPIFGETTKTGARKDMPPGVRDLANPRAVIRMLNRRFPLGEGSGMFCTMVYAVLNTETATLEWMRAGHVPPLWLRGGGREPKFLQHPDGLLVGVSSMELPNQKTGKITLEPGDRFVLYSDGLVEAEAEENEKEFGYRRLAKVLTSNAERPIQEALQEVVSASKAWAGREVFVDDVTLLALEREK